MLLTASLSNVPTVNDLQLRYVLFCNSVHLGLMKQDLEFAVTKTSLQRKSSKNRWQTHITIHNKNEPGAPSVTGTNSFNRLNQLKLPSCKQLFHEGCCLRIDWDFICGGHTGESTDRQIFLQALTHIYCFYSSSITIFFTQMLYSLLFTEFSASGTPQTDSH